MTKIITSLVLLASILAGIGQVQAAPMLKLNTTVESPYIDFMDR